ncbi:MAG: MarR family transcriptional regulator [Methanothrix sp.]|nr:MarR family transcriptional regulator [Methanothrix sp.]
MDDEDEIAGSCNQDVRRHIINACIQWARMKGYSDSIGFLRGLTVLAREPVSLDELVLQTGYSKSTVSSNMNLLEGQRLVRRIVIPGDKRHIYAPIVDPEIIMANMLDAIDREILLFCEALDRTEKELAAGSAEEKWLSERVATLRQSYERSERIVKFLRTKSFYEI